MKRTVSEADRLQAVYTWLTAAEVAETYFRSAADDEKTAVSASTILRWHDDPSHPIKGVDWSKEGASKRLILFRPEDVEAAIQRQVDAA